MRSLKHLAKTVVARISPGLAGLLQAHFAQRHSERIAKRRGLLKLESQWREEKGDSVVTGPFRGMKYLETSDGSALLPKLIGSYEKELHHPLACCIELSIPRVVDIGCAEGYYAVGLAKALPDATIVAFDTSKRARTNCQRLAEINGVEDRVSIRGECKHPTLSEAITPGALIVCDCEGGEWDLLNTEAVGLLREAYLLVELHGESVETVVARFSERFESTHEIEFIVSVERDGSEAAALDCWTDAQRRLAVDEMRSQSQVWAWAKPSLAGG